MELFEKEKKQLKITVCMISIFEVIYVSLDSIFLHFNSETRKFEKLSRQIKSRVRSTIYIERFLQQKVCPKSFS